MKRSCIAVLACLATFFAAPSVAAPVQWSVASGGNGNWYELSEIPGSIYTAQYYAGVANHMGLQGYLATVTSAAELAFLSTSVNPEGKPAWLGASDSETEGTWKWIAGPETGQELVYENWSGGNPDDAKNAVTGTGEDYLLGWASGDLWDDRFHAFDSYFDVDGDEYVDLYLTAHWIIEYGAGTPKPVPLPAALPLLSIALGALGLAARRRKAA